MFFHNAFELKFNVSEEFLFFFLRLFCVRKRVVKLPTTFDFYVNCVCISDPKIFIRVIDTNNCIFVECQIS